MKKSLLIAAAVMITFGACTNDESAPEQNEIGFKAITTNSTRAILAAGGLPITESFDVWGYYSTQNENFADIEAGENSNFMKEIKIEYITTELKWRNLARKYYWPSTGKIGFYAMYPSGTYNTYKGTTEPDYKTNGIKIVDYEINNATKQTDLMYGYAESGSISTALTLTFQHALSQVLFNLCTKETYPDVKFYVTKISLKNIDTQAGFQFKLNANNHLAPTPTFSYTAGWSNNEDNRTSVLEYYASNIEIVKTPADYGTDKSIVVIPQSLIKDAGSESRLVIEYKMAQGVDTSVPSDGIGDDVQTGTVEKVLSNTAWEMGKKYIYNLTFNLSEINFNPQVSSWILEETEELDLDIPASN